MPAAGGCSRPRRGHSEQQGCAQGEGQDDRAAARSRQSGFGVRNDAVDATLGFGSRKARRRGYHAGLVERGPLVVGHEPLGGTGEGQ